MSSAKMSPRGTAGAVPLPEWAAHALNGKSTRPTRPWGYDAGDVLAGEVVEAREKRGQGSDWPAHRLLVVRVEAATERGQAVEAGEWLSIECYPMTLRRWVDRDAPKVGDRVAVQFRGQLTRGKGGLNFVAGTHRAVPEGWE